MARKREEVQIHSQTMSSESDNLQTTPHYYWGCCYVCRLSTFDVSAGGERRFSVSLKRCARCQSISYCGAEHQRAHWKKHKKLCNYLKAAADEVGADTFFAAGTGSVISTLDLFRG